METIECSYCKGNINKFDVFVKSSSDFHVDCFNNYEKNKNNLDECKKKVAKNLFKDLEKDFILLFNKGMNFNFIDNCGNRRPKGMKLIYY